MKTIFRALLFFLVTLLQAIIKLYTVHGTTFTQALATIYLVSFLLLKIAAATAHWDQAERVPANQTTRIYTEVTVLAVSIGLALCSLHCRHICHSPGLLNLRRLTFPVLFL